MPDVNPPAKDWLIDKPGARPVAPPGGQVADPPHGARRRGVAWAILLIALVLGSGAGGTWWWIKHRPQPQAQAAAPIKVPVVTVAPRTIPVYRSFPATTESMRSVAIQARVTGYLVEHGAADGADVGADALLYRIDPSDYQASLAQAQAQVNRSAASLDYARVSQGRKQALLQNGWVTRDTADQVNSTYQQGRASLAGDSAALHVAVLNLGRTEIRAPFAGRLSHSQVFEGSLISVAGTTLNTLVQLDPIYVRFNPAEANLEAITTEQARRPIETTVSVEGGGVAHTGPVTFLDNQVDRSTGTILMRATISNPDRALLPGQYVTARLHLGDRAGALLVPQDAVGSSQIGRTLMIVGAGDKAEQRMIKLGENVGDMVIVTDGLKPGDRVITGQLQKLKPGALVSPEPESTP